MYSIKNKDDIQYILKYHRANDMVNIMKFFPGLSPIDDLAVVVSEEDYLENKVIPPIPTTDIGYMYYIDLANFTPQGASAPVSKILLDTWNVSLETLHTTALANTENIMRPCVRPMNSVVQELLNTDEEVVFGEAMTMYVITSKQMMNGAILATLPSICSKLQQQ